MDDYIYAWLFDIKTSIDESGLLADVNKNNNNYPLVAGKK